MKVRLLAALMVLVYGCDTFYGPKLRNDFGYDVTVTILYSDGRSATTVWPFCRASFIGGKDIQIDKVSIEKDGKLLREFGADEIRDLMEKEQAIEGYSVWSVSEKGVSLDTRSSADGCGQGVSTTR